MNERAKDELILFAGHSNPALAAAVARDLGVGLGAAEVRTFSDGEILVEIDENVRGGDVFVLQSICTPGNDNLMQLLLMLDALKRASAKRITAVMPYYGYARQDRKVAPRVPISAKLIADLVTTAGASRVLTMDLHAGQIQGFFNIPVDNLYATPVLLPYIRERVAGDQVAVVSPDAGGVERARAVAKRLDAGLAIIDKRRPGPNEVAEMRIIGDVVGLLGDSRGRHRRHRGHDRHGGRRAARGGRPTRDRLLYPRRAFGARHRTAESLGHRAARRYRHDPARCGSGAER